MANPDEWAAWRAGVAQAQPNVALDTTQSGVTGVHQGFSSIPGMFGDMQEVGRQVASVVPYWAARAGGADDEDARRQAQQVIDVARQAAQARHVQLPTTRDVNDAALSIEPDSVREWTNHEPQTTPGRYAREIGRFAPAALIPGSAAMRTARVVAPGMGSELAGEATAGTPLEPYARFTGALVGGLGAEGARFVADTPNRMAATATEGMTDADMIAAQALRQRLAALGIDITVAEAAQQVTHGGTGMAGLQDFVEASRHGAPTMAPFMRNRPQQMESAVTDFANRVAPPTDNPSALGPQIQSYASDELNAVRRDINARARPDYQAAETQTMPTADYQVLAADPVYAEGLRRLRADPELGAQFNGVPDNNIGLIGEVYRSIRDRASAASVSGEHNLARIRGNTANTADAALSNASPEWARAQQTVAQGHAQELAPLEAGPLGRLENSQTLNTGIVFPTAPPAGGAAETVDTIRRLGARDPDATRQFARQHVLGGRTGAQEQMQDLSSGPNQYAGARWAANIAGNPEQERALIEGFRALPGNGPQLADELATLVEGGQATGRRIPRNSQTFSRTEAGEQTRRLLPDIRRIGGDIVSGQRIRTLSEFLTAHPDETEAVLRQMRARSGRFRMPLAEAVLAGQAQEQQQ